MLDIIADRCDYVWYIAADGKVYFNDGTTASGDAVTEISGIDGKVTISDIKTQINYVKVYGGYDFLHCERES